jgi:hypothetical protein
MYPPGMGDCPQPCELLRTPQWRRSVYASRATTAWVGGFTLLTVLIYVADEHPAFEATAGTLQAGVVSLNGVVIVVMGVYPICVHSP